jgi:hypothetical protein
VTYLDDIETKPLQYRYVCEMWHRRPA